MTTKRCFRRLALMTMLLPVMVVLCGCPEDQTLTLVATLTKDRQTVEEYVKEVKQHLNVTDPRYQEARQRYLAAFSMYEGYVTAVRLSIQTGMPGDLQSLGTQSAAKTNEFVTYAADNLPKARSLLALLPHFASIVSYVIAVKNKRRTQIATMFYQAVQWKDWDSIAAAPIATGDF